MIETLSSQRNASPRIPGHHMSVASTHGQRRYNNANINKRIELGEIGLKILLPNHIVGSLMGPAGTSLKSLKSVVTSKIYISENRYPGTDLRCVYLLGNGNSLIDCQKRILTLIAENQTVQKSKNDVWDPTKENYDLYAEIDIEVKVGIPQQCAGMLLGKSGSTLTAIQEESSVDLLFMTGKDDPSTYITHERVVTIKGQAAKCIHCVNMIINKFSDNSELAQYVFGSNFSASASHAVANQQLNQVLNGSRYFHQNQNQIQNQSQSQNIHQNHNHNLPQSPTSMSNVMNHNNIIPHNNNYIENNSNLGLTLNSQNSQQSPTSHNTSHNTSQNSLQSANSSSSSLNEFPSDGNGNSNNNGLLTRGIFDGLGTGLGLNLGGLTGNSISNNNMNQNNNSFLSNNNLDMGDLSALVNNNDDCGLIELAMKTTLELAIHDKHVGNIIGPARLTLLEISNVTGALVNVTQRGDIPQPHHRRLIIEGANQAIIAACNLIRLKISQANGGAN
jgi:hypothetical protein